MGIKVNTSDFDRLARDFTRAEAALAPGLKAAVQAASEAGAEAARELAPVGATGDLRDSIKAMDVRGGTGAAGFSGGFAANVYYAAYLEYGTARGIEPHGFMQAARDSVPDVLQKGAEDAISKALP